MPPPPPEYVVTQSAAIRRDLITFRPEELDPIIDEYLSLPTFMEKNKFAFKFGNRLNADWWSRLALKAEMIDSSSSRFQCISHLASARFTKSAGSANILSMLHSENENMVKGVMKLILDSRILEPNGFDQAWPETRPFGSDLLPSHIAKLAFDKPKFLEQAIEVLKKYGEASVALKTEIVSALESTDPNTRKTAIALLLSISPAFSREFDLDVRNEGHSFDKTRVRQYLSRSISAVSSVDYWSEKLRPSVSLPFSRRHEEFVKLANTINTDDDYHGFALYADATASYQDLRHLSSLLYLRTGAKAEIARILQSKDRVVVRGGMHILSGFYLFQNNQEYNSPPEIGVFAGDEDFWPPVIGLALELHPDLILDAARTIAYYRGPNTLKVFREKIGPVLLSDDPVLVTQTRMTFSEIDPASANKLGVFLSRGDGMFALSQDEATCLSLTQRHAVDEILVEKER